MKIIHLVTCRDCGYPAYEIESRGSMRKYYCKRCNLIFMKFEEEPSRRKK